MHACYKGIHSSCLVSRALLLTATDQTNNGRIKMIEKSDLSLENVSFEWQGEICSGSEALGLSIYTVCIDLCSLPKAVKFFKIIWICVVLNNSTGKLVLSWQTSAALPSLFSLYFLLWPQFRKDQYNNRSMLNNKTTIIIWTELFYCTESKHTTEDENAQKKTCFISNMHVELQLTVFTIKYTTCFRPSLVCATGIVTH